MDWHALLRRHPSAFLLATQLFSLVLYPVMDGKHEGRLLFGAVGVIVVALALWVVNRSPITNWVAWLLAVPAVVLTVSGVVLDREILFTWSAMFESALYFYVAGGLIAYMLHDHEVTADELYAAGATFTLLAWGFAYAYFVCQAWYPGSFTGLTDPGQPRSWMELLFLSFTCLSGVGLGDVLPLSAPARTLVMLEELAGVGYIATVVSRLIGLTILRQRDRR
jgi:hypothetical protein